MNTWYRVSTIAINDYCICLQDELTSPLGDISCFASRKITLVIL
jgi:hypothetical protein